MENRWTHIRIDYHSSTTSEPTNQVCYSPQKNYKKETNYANKIEDKIYQQ